MPTHGEYVAGSGWFDDSLEAYHSHASQVTGILPDYRIRRPELPTDSGYRNPASAEQRAAHAARSWRPNPEMEALRRLRDSDRAEDRERAEQMLTGRRRTAMARYEEGLTAFAAHGGELPDGVARP